MDGWMDVLLGQTPVTELHWTPSPQSQAEEQLRPNCRAGQLLLQLEKKYPNHIITSHLQRQNPAFKHWLIFCLTVKTHCNDEPKTAVSESRKLKRTKMEILSVLAQLTSNCLYHKDIINNYPKLTLFCASVIHKSSWLLCCVEAVIA